jgi:hypothetical protein
LIFDWIREKKNPGNAFPGLKCHANASGAAPSSSGRGSGCASARQRVCRVQKAIANNVTLDTATQTAAKTNNVIPRYKHNRCQHSKNRELMVISVYWNVGIMADKLSGFESGH